MAYVIIEGEGLQGVSRRRARHGLGGPLKLTIEHLGARLGANALGATGLQPAKDPTLRAEIVKWGIVALTTAIAQAKVLADKLVAKTPFDVPHQVVIREWRRTFTAQVEAMVVRVMTVGRDGVHPFERNPKLLDDIADFVESEAASMGAAVHEYTALSALLRQAAVAIAQQSGKTLATVVREGLKALPPPTTAAGVATTLVILGALGLGAAYVYRSFK